MHAALARLRENIAKVYLGNPEAIDRVIICLLARGHLLIEDVPGVGKTILATALARSVDCVFSRIQLTPDLLPSDVLGVTVFDRNTSQFTFTKGPIFANIVLADEINRTPPRTQAAMLEAMNDSAVSIDGKTLPLDLPFMVIATQNPFEYEGTYLLPENQLDRFLMRISLGYPSAADEARVLELRPSNSPLHTLGPVLSRAEVLELQAATDAVRVDRKLIDYIIRFANATRRNEAVQVGLSPRATLALAHAARATALYRGRDHVVPEDITFNIAPVCAHRVIPHAAMGSGADGSARIVQSVLETIPSPV
jgi:MoxR-like ATPase